MNIRWNQVAAAVAVGFLFGALFSDFYRTHRWTTHHWVEGPIEMFSRELRLSEQQKEKVSAVFEKYRPEMDAAMNENRAQMDKVKEKIRVELKTIITEEQAKKLAEIEKDFERHGPPPMGKTGLEPRPHMGTAHYGMSGPGGGHSGKGAPPTSDAD